VRILTVPTRSKIEAKLRQMRWSPEQISGWLSEQGIKLSHERIYQMMWDDKRDGGNLWRSLRRRGKRYSRRAGKNAGRGLIPNRIDISERPAIVARKTRLETGRATPSSAPDTKAACSRWSSAKPN
jgi:IS30 family transposase